MMWLITKDLLPYRDEVVMVTISDFTLTSKNINFQTFEHTIQQHILCLAITCVI